MITAVLMDDALFVGKYPHLRVANPVVFLETVRIATAS